MSEVEPHLVTLILAMAQARRCLRANKCISLANDLIKGTEVQKKIIHRKKKKIGSGKMTIHLCSEENIGNCLSRDGGTS